MKRLGTGRRVGPFPKLHIVSPIARNAFSVLEGRYREADLMFSKFGSNRTSRTLPA